MTMQDDEREVFVTEEAAVEATGGGPLWQRIRAALGADLDEGRYPPGAKLPTEAELSRRFGANRHTVRRALDTLRREGRIHVRRGAGAFVTQARLDYAIGPRTRFSRNLTELGLTPGRALLRSETVPAGPREASALGIAEGAPVVLAETVADADGVPVLYARSFYPAERLDGIRAALEASSSITEALRRCGCGDYQRLWTRLVAELPEPIVARHLRMPETSPVLRSEGLNIGAEGEPVEYGLTWFCSERIALVVDRSSFT